MQQTHLVQTSSDLMLGFKIVCLSHIIRFERNKKCGGNPFFGLLFVYTDA